VSRICRECKKGTLKILGLGPYEDTIEVECQNPECTAEYSLEPDGLGDAGLEMEEAYEAEMKRRKQEEEDDDGEETSEASE